MNNQEIAIQSGVHGKSYPAEFNRLFPGATNVISYYTGLVGDPAWTSSTGLYQRYIFKMHHTIKLDSSRTKIVSTGTPSFYLYELTEIKFKTNGAPVMQGRQISTTSFSIETWQKLVAVNGDFKAVGIILETNKPIENFDEAWWKL